MFDLVGAVELTASSAIVIAVVSVAFGRNPRSRVLLAVALAAWFVVVVALAATDVAQYERGAGTPFVGLAVAVPIVVLSLVLFGLPALREQVERVPLWLLTAVHAVRLLGISFVLLHASGRLPAPFAPVAGWGDIAVGAAALPVAWMVGNRSPGWRGWLLVWNTLGLADLATAVTLGVLSSPGPLWVLTSEPGTGIMSTLPWFLIPGFLVPLLATTHIVIFFRLLRRESAEEID